MTVPGLHRAAGAPSWSNGTCASSRRDDPRSGHPVMEASRKGATQGTSDPGHGDSGQGDPGQGDWARTTSGHGVSVQRCVWQGVMTGGHWLGCANGPAGAVDLNIVDRRLNPRGKSLGNRQRFMRRARKQIMDAMRDSAGKSRISDVSGGDRIKITTDGLREPSFRHASSGGERQGVLPGNKQYVQEGDKYQAGRNPVGAPAAGREGAEDGGRRGQLPVRRSARKSFSTSSSTI